jgi:hypothetical protein
VSVITNPRFRCDDCFAPATRIGRRLGHYWLEEYYCEDCVEPCTKGFDIEVSPIFPVSKPTSYLDRLPANGNFSEEDLWEAIADANGVDSSEIMDGDLAEWL